MKKTAKKQPMTDVEMRERLEEIARNRTNHSAAIQAMRFLREMDDGIQPAAESFEALDNVAPIRRKAT